MTHVRNSLSGPCQAIEPCPQVGRDKMAGYNPFQYPLPGPSWVTYMTTNNPPPLGCYPLYAWVLTCPVTYTCGILFKITSHTKHASKFVKSTEAFSTNIKKTLGISNVLKM